MRDATARSHDHEFRRTLKGAAYRSIQPLAINAIGVPAIAYIIRRLGAGGYGEWTVATSLIATTTVLTNLGLRGPFVRKVARDPSGVPEALAAQLGIRTSLAIVSSAVTVAVALCLSYSATVVACTAVAAMGMTLASIASTGTDLLEGFQRMPEVAAVNFVAGLVLTAASLVAVWFLPNPVILSVSYLTGPLTSLVILAWIVQRSGVRIRLELTVAHGLSLLWQARHFAVQQFVFAASNGLALLLLPKLIGTVAFGMFAVGTLLVTRLTIFPDATATALYALISKSAAGDPRTLRRRVGFGIALSVGVCSLLAAAVWIASGVIAGVLLPSEPAACRYLIQVTAWALPLVGLEMMMVFVLNALGREAIQAKLSIVGSICSLLIGTLLISTWGTAGACWFMLARPVVAMAFLLPTLVRSMPASEFQEALQGRDSRAPRSGAAPTTGRLCPPAGATNSYITAGASAVSGPP
jgi:O-antigen/teichoic acid export membrane protein